MALGEKSFPTPSPRSTKYAKSGIGWPNKWSALILVLVASVMLLLQTEVSVFSGHLTQAPDVRSVDLGGIDRGPTKGNGEIQTDFQQSEVSEWRSFGQQDKVMDVRGRVDLADIDRKEEAGEMDSGLIPGQGQDPLTGPGETRVSSMSTEKERAAGGIQEKEREDAGGLDGDGDRSGEGGEGAGAVDEGRELGDLEDTGDSGEGKASTEGEGEDGAIKISVNNLEESTSSKDGNTGTEASHTEKDGIKAGELGSGNEDDSNKKLGGTENLRATSGSRLVNDDEATDAEMKSNLEVEEIETAQEQEHDKGVAEMGEKEAEQSRLADGEGDERGAAKIEDNSADALESRSGEEEEKGVTENGSSNADAEESLSAIDEDHEREGAKPDRGNEEEGGTESVLEEDDRREAAEVSNLSRGGGVGELKLTTEDDDAKSGGEVFKDSQAERGELAGEAEDDHETADDKGKTPFSEPKVQFTKGQTEDQPIVAKEESGEAKLGELEDPTEGRIENAASNSGSQTQSSEENPHQLKLDVDSANEKKSDVVQVNGGTLNAHRLTEASSREFSEDMAGDRQDSSRNEGSNAEQVPTEHVPKETKQMKAADSAPRGRKPAAPARRLSCRGRYVYMYDLPRMFNADFVANCKHIHRSVNMCKAFNNSGMGRPARVKRNKDGSTLELIPPGTWFESDQFSLEITFHARMLEYPCLTKDPKKATVFYVPFFPGLAIFRSLYEKNLAERDRHARLVIEWLGKLPWWDRRAGVDHLFVVTRVLIDFTRTVVRNDWGNTFMSMSHMRNATVLGIEGHTHKSLQNAQSIPYPTSFHPATDDDIRTWQDFIRNYPRKYRIAFGGVGHGMGAQIRFKLMELCGRARPHCRLFHCGKRMCMRPHNVIWHYASAHFCFQPPGDTPTRKGMFDCMLAGGIPVLFHEQTAYRYFWHLPADHESYSVFQSRADFWKDNGTAILERLKRFSMSDIERMRENVIRLIPQIAYAMPGQTLHEFRDAFDIAVEMVVQKVSKLRLRGHPHLPRSEWIKDERQNMLATQKR